MTDVKLESPESIPHYSPGNLLSNISLIAGTTIGAGILALPAATLPAGLLPSSLILIAAWLYMAASGLLIAEVNLQTMAVLGKPYLGFLATVQHHLGTVGAAFAGLLYAFNHYALLVAYTARGGDILAAALYQSEKFFGLSQPIPLWWGHIVFTGLFGSLLFWGSVQFIGRLSTVLLGIVIAAFFGLLALTTGQIHSEQWLVQHWEAVSVAVPVMFVAFVFHNVVPVVTTRLEGNRTKIRQSILLGSLIPLILFLLWNAAILSSVSFLASSDTFDPDIFDPIERLRQATANPRLGLSVSVFSEFAIVTSFIGFVYGLQDFLEDLLGEPATNLLQRAGLYGLILLPPLGLSVLSPSIFFQAIDWAGAFGVSLLFGILPAVMVWKQRYSSGDGQASGSAVAFSPMVVGGKVTLAVMIGIAAAVLVEHGLMVIGVL